MIPHGNIKIIKSRYSNVFNCHSRSIMPFRLENQWRSDATGKARRTLKLLSTDWLRCSAAFPVGITWMNELHVYQNKAFVTVDRSNNGIEQAANFTGTRIANLNTNCLRKFYPFSLSTRSSVRFGNRCQVLAATIWPKTVVKTRDYLQYTYTQKFGSNALKKDTQTHAKTRIHKLWICSFVVVF